MSFIGYARISTIDQNYEIQVTVLKSQAARKSFLKRKVVPLLRAERNWNYA